MGVSSEFPTMTSYILFCIDTKISKRMSRRSANLLILDISISQLLNRWSYIAQNRITSKLEQPRSVQKFLALADVSFSSYRADKLFSQQSDYKNHAKNIIFAWLKIHIIIILPVTSIPGQEKDVLWFWFMTNSVIDAATRFLV